MAFLTVSQVFLSMQVYNQYNYCFLNTTQGSEFVLQFHWPSNNVFRFQELNSRLLTLFPNAQGPGVRGLGSRPPPDTLYEHRHPSWWKPAPGGKTLTGFLQNLHFLPFSLMCFICHHHKTILSLQMKYFITKRQKQKKLRGSCTGWRTSSVPQLALHCEQRRHRVSAGGPTPNSIFWALIVSIVLATKSGVCSRSRVCFTVSFN